MVCWQPGSRCERLGLHPRSWHAGVDEPARPETFPLVRVRDSGREFMVWRNTAIMAGAAGLVGLAACGGPAAGSGPASSGPARPATTAVPAPHRGRHHHKVASHHPGRHRGTAGNGLLAVHDPGMVTGRLTGACRTRDRGLLPDRSCTPGAIDPAVTQANIGSTICRAGYTDSVRPPESQTEAFKWGVAEPAYGQHDVSGELDHLVPLELGGDNDARNLWVEAGPIPNGKDAVENALNHAVCDGAITLRAARREIARNWIKAAASQVSAFAGPAALRPPAGPHGARRLPPTARSTRTGTSSCTPTSRMRPSPPAAGTTPTAGTPMPADTPTYTCAALRPARQ